MILVTSQEIHPQTQRLLTPAAATGYWGPEETLSPVVRDGKV